MNAWKPIVALGLMLALGLLLACGTAPTEAPQPNMPNPASVFCEDKGGTLDLRTDQAGGQYGVCVFDGSECEEWAFYRGECAAGQMELAPEPTQ